MLLGNNMHVKTQALEKVVVPYFSHGLHVVNTNTEITMRSRQIAVVVMNLTTAPITIAKSIKVTHVIATDMVPPVEVAPGTLEKLDEMQGIQQTVMSAE